jgi:hypothetical protein
MHVDGSEKLNSLYMRKTDCIETENERRAFQSLKEKESL